MALIPYRIGNSNFQAFAPTHLADKLKQMTKNKFAKPHHRCRPTANRRSEKRLLCSDLIKMRWVDRNGTRREEIVVLEGYSISGASLLAGVSIGEGTPVTLCGGDEELRATVRHCAPGSNGYLVGIHFGNQGWTYVPEHSLDLSLLSYSKEKEGLKSVQPDA